MKMRVSVLQHAAYEGPGEIAAWATQHGHAVSIHHLYRGDPLPRPDAFDFLVVMGGEMNIYQYRDWPWLKSESAFLRSAFAAGKRAIARRRDVRARASRPGKADPHRRRRRESAPHAW